jgi:hypothetical protein
MCCAVFRNADKERLEEMEGSCSKRLRFLFAARGAGAIRAAVAYEQMNISTGP